jgi:hypothetical protein
MGRLTVALFDQVTGVGVIVIAVSADFSCDNDGVLGDSGCAPMPAPESSHVLGAGYDGAKSAMTVVSIPTCGS